MIKKITGSIREYKKASIYTPIFVALEVVVECFIPFTIAKLINNITAGCELIVIVKYGSVLLLMALVSLFLGAISGVYCAEASSGLGKNLRHDVFYKIQGYSFSNIDKFSSSSLVTRLTTDITNVQMAYMMIIRIAVRSPLVLIFGLTMSFTMSPRLSTIFVAVVPFLALALFLIIQKAFPLFTSAFKKYDSLNNSVQENVKGMRVVKSFVREDFEKQKFAKASGDVCDVFSRVEKIVALNNPLMQLTSYIGMMFISIFGAKIIISTKGSALEIGELSSLITYSMQILSSLMMLSMIFVMVMMATASAKRISEALDEDSTIKNPENPVNEVKDGSIEFNNVYFKYYKNAEKNALENINISIKSGETIGIIGATGSSKTSLVQLIPRLYDVSEGNVAVGGIDVRNYDISVLRDQVAVVLQKNVLFSGTIKENLRWGDKNASDEELVRVCKLAQADNFISSFPDGYDTHIEQGGTNVSGGQKQRLCIARALLKKPKIIILDDSTSAVDTKTDSLIRTAFENEIPNTTKIIIAQRISSVENADKIIILEDGMVNAIGNHKELLASNEIYKEIYYSQNKAGENDARQ